MDLGPGALQDESPFAVDAVDETDFACMLVVQGGGPCTFRRATLDFKQTAFLDDVHIVSFADAIDLEAERARVRAHAESMRAVRLLRRAQLPGAERRQAKRRARKAAHGPVEGDGHLRRLLPHRDAEAKDVRGKKGDRELDKALVWHVWCVVIFSSFASSGYAGDFAASRRTHQFSGGSGASHQQRAGIYRFWSSGIIPRCSICSPCSVHVSSSAYRAVSNPVVLTSP